MLVPDSDDGSSEDDINYFGEALMGTADDSDSESTSPSLEVSVDSEVSEDEECCSESSCEPFESECEEDTQRLATQPSAQPSATLLSASPSDLTPSEPAPAELATPCTEASFTAGYKLIFDNIDKNIKPRYMRSDSQTRSLHYVQAYALKDRINYAQLCSGATVTPTEINVYDILPNGDDYKSLKGHFSTLVSRMIVEYLPFFADDFKDLTPRHISHKYSKEMSMKSHVVS